MPPALPNIETEESWIYNRWRPMMGWMYMVVCIFDFIVAPILWSILQATFHQTPIIQWNPLTLQGAGLFHMAMGAVLGVAAWTRSQEKITAFNGQPNPFNNNPFTQQSTVTDVTNTDGQTPVPQSQFNSTQAANTDPVPPPNYPIQPVANDIPAPILRPHPPKK